MKFNIIYIAQAFKPSYKLSHVGHHLWKQVIRPGDIAIDATCGNGLDSLLLAQSCIQSSSPTSSSSGQLYCFDIQKIAIDKTRAKLEENGFTKQVEYICGSHASFPSTIQPQSVACIVYNLGFLPGSDDKSVVTKTESTIDSLKAALNLIQPGGLVSVMAYQGHKGGGRETEAVIDFFETLPLSPEWRLSMYGVENQPVAPILITAHRQTHEGEGELTLPPPSNADVFARKKGK